MPRWKTITTYLLDWNPNWVKIVELSSWIWKALVIPRSQLANIKDREELKNPAIYFLFWDDSEWNSKVYIWEAENLINRIANHDAKKDFWTTVVAFVSEGKNLTKAHVKYLEAKSIIKTKESKIYELENTTTPNINSLPEHQVDIMEDFLDNIDLLISAIWYPIFKTTTTSKELKKKELYYLNEKQWLVSGVGVYTESWFLVQKWSKWSLQMASSEIKKQQYCFKNRPKLEKKWIIKSEWDYIIFLEDYLFSSPSSASNILCWRATNWWTSWKDKNWVTLDENERQKLK